MNKYTTLRSRFGHIDVYINDDRNIIFAQPYGYVSPALIKKDLAFLSQWDSDCPRTWKYIVDISNVKVIHPMNPFLLRRIKQFSKMEEYVVYAPSSLMRLMIGTMGFIVKPDRIVSNLDLLD